tara:strand:- start:716 stop:1216 length:501 start_codon:yes stop_codon:yes gene_type:complete
VTLLSFQASADIVAIEQLKARYAMFADAKYRPNHSQAEPHVLAEAARGQASCFTEDAYWDAGAEFGGILHGRSALEDFFSNPPWRYAVHFYASPMFEKVGDRATAIWRLWQICLPLDQNEPILLAATTQEEFVKTSKGWLHQRVRFKTLDRLPVPGGQLQALGQQI